MLYQNNHNKIKSIDKSWDHAEQLKLKKSENKPK